MYEPTHTDIYGHKYSISYDPCEDGNNWHIMVLSHNRWVYAGHCSMDLLRREFTKIEVTLD